MASPPSSLYQNTIRNVIRVRQMCDAASSKVFRKLLEWLTTPNWDPSTTSFHEYLRTKKNVKMKEFKKDLKPSQRRVMINDPRGDTWDVSLLYILILYGNEILADKNDSVWKTRTSPLQLEFLITCVKNERNEVMHSYEPMDDNIFLLKEWNIRQLLTEMIAMAGQLCCRQETEVDQIIQELNEIITKCRDDPLEPEAFSNYKRKLVLGKGKQILFDQHAKYKTYAPISHLVKVNVPVEDVLTEMVLAGETKGRLNVKDVLSGENKVITDSIILVEGDAGIGKTTFTKMLLSDWINEKGEISGLDRFDLVLHAECRNHTDSLKGFLAYSMKELSQSFMGDDLIYVIGNLRILIIIDGFDELNPGSTKLFKEILQLKRTGDNISVIVTTRPEALKAYNQFTSPIPTKHIRLLGIPPEKRDEFVQKYFSGIEKGGSNAGDINVLLEYLRKTEHTLGYLWRLPYNITLLIILWIMKPFVINNITSAPELHLEMLLLHVEKLEERLRNNALTQHLSPLELKWKIEVFLYSVCEEALRALADDPITLDQEAYMRLVQKCHELAVPVEEMLAMFLKHIETASGTRYSFPHKGLIDFLAARYIYLELTEDWNRSDIQKLKTDVQSFLSNQAAPHKLCNEIMEVIEHHRRKPLGQSTSSTSAGATKKKSTVIADILIRKQKSQNVDINKYQNLLISLTGMFYLGKNKIEESAKDEALKLLEMTGITRREHWLQVLNGVRCDQHVASFIIRKHPEILDKDTLISDNNLSAYISLIRALDPVCVNKNDINISIDIWERREDANALLREINAHMLNVTRLEFHYDFRHPSSPIMDPSAITQIFSRSACAYLMHFVSAMDTNGNRTSSSCVTGLKGNMSKLEEEEEVEKLQKM